MSDMYDDLIRKREDTEEQYKLVLQRIEKYEYILKRLKKAKIVVKKLKEDCFEIKQKHKKIASKNHKWKGKTYRSFDTMMDSIDDNNNYYYKYQLDRILDSLNDEMTRIENKIMRETGLLGELGSIINSVCNEIEKRFN